MCKLLKGQINDWNKWRLDNIFRQVQEVDAKLSTLHSQLCSDQTNQHLLKLQDMLLSKSEKLFSDQVTYSK